MLEPRSSLATYLTNLQAEGRITFTREEAIAALGIYGRCFPKGCGSIAEASQAIQSSSRFLRCCPTAISIVAGSAAILVYRSVDAA